MPRVHDRIKLYFQSPKIIHIVGTNGKGTTGRFLASSLHSLGYKVGHYTSPHILNFNERIWLNGNDILNEELDRAHQSLLKILTREEAESLSYFEYTTFLAMYIYKDLEYVVLEAGLGGEFDATAVFKNELTLVTPIGIDHEAFLGNSIAQISKTKLNAVQKQAILAEQASKEVYEVTRKVLGDKKIAYEKAQTYINSDDKRKIALIVEKLSLPLYLNNNLLLAISALKYFNINYSSDSFDEAKLFGRLTYLRENIVVDVGHNVLAAKAILDALRAQKFILVYNSFKDKDYKEILTILKPIIEHVEIIDIHDERAESKDVLEETLVELDIVHKSFSKINSSKNYLVFGSFSVVEIFLKVYSE